MLGKNVSVFYYDAWKYIISAAIGAYWGNPDKYRGGGGLRITRKGRDEICAGGIEWEGGALQVAMDDFYGILETRNKFLDNNLI